MEDINKIAENGLKYWVLAIETNNWQPYLEMLDEDYTFWIPKDGFKYKTNDSVISHKQIIDFELNANRLKAYSSPPSRISIGPITVVFEFIYSAINSKEHFQNCMALSFDIKNGKISACREYHFVLMKL